jgi:acyl carrier protein
MPFPEFFPVKLFFNNGLAPMRRFLPQSADQRLRKRLVAIIESSDVECDEEVTDDTSLIKSGRLDSLGLLNLAVFIESEIGSKLDVASFDFSEEWDTIAAILTFVVTRRTTKWRFRERVLTHLKAHRES